MSELVEVLEGLSGPSLKRERDALIAEVERCRRDPAGSPLLYHGGRFYTEHPL